MVDNGPVEDAVRTILDWIGEDVEREGLQDTPTRVARMYGELFSGLSEDPGLHLKKTFTTDSAEMVIVQDIPFASTCEHHLVPFTGYCHIGYIPNEIKYEGDHELQPKRYRITGLSKLARVVDGFARRPQVQEQLTTQIAECIQEYLAPLGCIVIMKAEHMCMTIRGVQKPGTMTKTSAVRGIFEYNKDGVKNEFFSLLEV